MRDLGKAVVKPAVQCVWSGKSRGGHESQIGEQRGDVIPVRVFPVLAPGWGL